MKTILGIDPGLQGAFVWLGSNGVMYHEKMPLTDKQIDFGKVKKLLKIWSAHHVYLERAVAFGMGTTSAFNYGRGFATLEIAIQVVGLPVTYVEPHKWSKVIHEGIDKRLKPKEKSLIAVKRLHPKLVKEIPTNKNGKMHEGVVDALLIAGYGMRESNQRIQKDLEESEFDL